MSLHSIYVSGLIFLFSIMASGCAMTPKGGFRWSGHSDVETLEDGTTMTYMGVKYAL